MQLGPEDASRFLRIAGWLCFHASLQSSHYLKDEIGVFEFY
jgi:hypothetical protein